MFFNHTYPVKSNLIPNFDVSILYRLTGILVYLAYFR